MQKEQWEKVLKIDPHFEGTRKNLEILDEPLKQTSEQK
jgi:hypothetical protein